MPTQDNPIVKSVTTLTDTVIIIFLLWFGITNNLFNWGADWWYSLLTLIVFLSAFRITIFNIEKIK